MRRHRPALAPLVALLACGGSSGEGDLGGEATAIDGGATEVDAATIDPGAGDAGGGEDVGGDASAALASRDRLLATYLEFLDASPDVPQSNGLRGADLDDVCDLWDALDGSSRAVFLTVTARLEGSRLADGTSMLDHATRAYRVVGGEGATGDDPGSCGGGEFNRVILSIDEALHAALIAAGEREGEPGPTGAFDLADIPEGTSWRDSHDAAGPHAPFDASDETDEGAPRGQVHYFRDPTSPPATSPLGRLDLADLVDPLAFEMDQDYDCAHSSNPSCDYTFYGPLCIPQATEPGVEIYGESYGVVDLGWRPAGC